MKKLIYTVAIAAAVIVLVTGCSGKSEIQNGWKSMNLRGDVKSLRSIGYEPLQTADSVVKGEPLDYSQSDFYYEFNPEGFMTRSDWYTGGSVSTWDEYSYDEEGKLEKVVSRSVDYDGDATAEIEWTNDTDYIRRTYDNAGKVVKEEVVTVSKDKKERITKGANGVVEAEFITHFDKGRVSRVESKAQGRVVSMEYNYNDKGAESSLVTYESGKKVGELRLEYPAYDEKDNWTERIGYDIFDDEQGTPVELTERTIEYYK